MENLTRVNFMKWHTFTSAFPSAVLGPERKKLNPVPGIPRLITMARERFPRIIHPIRIPDKDVPRYPCEPCSPFRCILPGARVEIQIRPYSAGATSYAWPRLRSDASALRDLICHINPLNAVILHSWRWDTGAK